MDLFSPCTLGPVSLKNRFLKAATFEGRSPRGEVTDELISFHRVIAQGGVAMTTVAYLAVSSEGRTDRHCIELNDAARDGLTRLTKTVHAEGVAVAAQMGSRRSCWECSIERSEKPCPLIGRECDGGASS